MKLRNVLETGVWLSFLAATAVAAHAQTFTTLVYFKGGNGDNPLYGPLAQGLDGRFYGTTNYGGVGEGCIFKITRAGTLTIVHSFDGTDGANPYTGLILATDRNFYGATYGGGTGGINGTFYKLSPGGTLTSLHDFDITTGARPTASVIQSLSGAFYGTTSVSEIPVNSVGSIFRITPAGAITTLFNFSFTTGSDPYSGLVQATNGYFYGTTQSGGTNNQGTVFKINSSGTFTVLRNFDGTDGAGPTGTLIETPDGNLYGTTASGGPANHGTVFQITHGGTVTSLYSFHKTDGGEPVAGLIQATDGNLYGTTSVGGSSNQGTIFSITPGGTLTTLHNFGSGEGYDALAPLVQGTDGSFYGTTSRGGNGFPADGTVFNLSVGLNPFIRTVPTTGKVGTPVTILGTDLTGASSVTFNGVAAAFTVVSPTHISTTVPVGASTGSVRVDTPSATLFSNLSFAIKP
jgi:uncharacterized repeat protein (TIGR03803 family)